MTTECSGRTLEFQGAGRREVIARYRAFRPKLSMKAIVRDRYGSPDVLRLEEVEKPAPRDDELLIRVHAVSLNASDWEGVTGWMLGRLVGGGLLRPRAKLRILGSDIAGWVEAVGRNAKQFRPGDEVFADSLAYGCGGFAEYVCVPEKAPIAHKPAGFSYEQVATLPQAAVIAVRGIRDKGKVRPRQKVLINGAGGGAGGFAVQLAKSLGAEVTGVDNGEKLEVMRTFGADRVVDYTREDFTRDGERYDLILDLAAHRSLFDYRRALAPGGRYALVGGATSRVFQVGIVGSIVSLFSSKKSGILAVVPTKRDFATVVELLEAGTLVPVIDRCFPLEEVPQALQYLGDGLAKGKVVITV